MADKSAVRDGLSPPTRGNLSKCESRLIISGVYPRPRGGTPSCPSMDARRGGLSPPTRGNRAWGAYEKPAVRSIPAHAGEPPAFRV